MKHEQYAIFILQADNIYQNNLSLQQTTFTNWINDFLKAGKADRIVEDLGTDLRDGILLIRLLENLTKTKVKGFSGKDPKTEHHKRENLTFAFRFMRAESIKMIGVGELIKIF